MCAIFGMILLQDVDTGAIKIFESMSNFLRSRGPDGSWTYENERVLIGMHRLSLRSLENPQDPIVIEGNICSYNGEIYAVNIPTIGYIKLKSGGTEEVECLLNISSVEVPDGMFALASWNEELGDIKLFRDWLGIKPLFYTLNQKRCSFSSEIRGLVPALDSIDICRESLIDTFCFGWPLGERTIFKGVLEVEPGCSVSVSNLEIKRKKLPSHTTEIFPDKLTPSIFRRRLKSSLTNCLQGKEKLSLALSGGVDSSILAFELNELGIKDLSTFSVIPPGDGDGVRDLKELGLKDGGVWESWDHHVVYFEENEFVGLTEKAMDNFGHPTSMSSLPLYQKLADSVSSEGRRVLILGEGVDELFMGYESYHKFNNNAFLSLQDFYIKDADSLNDLFDEDAVSERIAIFKDIYETGDRLENLRKSQVDLRLKRLLYRSDTILMSAGIEGRTPFLHLGIPELALSLDSESLLGSDTKMWLRDIYRDHLPNMNNKKRRFKLPDNYLRRVLSSDPIVNFMLRSNSYSNELLPLSARKKVISSFLSGNDKCVDLIYLIYTTLLFLERAFESTVPEMINPRSLNEKFRVGKSNIRSSC